jgi:hypothetical protein
MYAATRFGCGVEDAFTQAPTLRAGLSAYAQQAARKAAIGDTWLQGHNTAGRVPAMVPSQVAYAAAAKERRERERERKAATGSGLAARMADGMGTAGGGGISSGFGGISSGLGSGFGGGGNTTRILPQGRQVDSLQVFADHRLANMAGPETMAGHVPVEGISLPQAQLGVPFTQRVPAPNIPFNPLAFSTGNGTSATSTGLPNNGLPYEWQGTLGLAGDYAGTVTDPYSGQVYAAYTDAMQEPKVLDEIPVIKLGEPSRMLEALTGTLSFPKPIPQEHFVEWSDIAEGVQYPQGVINGVVEARIAQQAAGETYMVNNETLAGYNDTNWDGYIGDTFVLRPVIDTQTLADNSQTNTVTMNRLQAPQVDAAFQLGQGLGAHVGSYWQPTVRLLAEEKPTGPGRPKRDFEPNGYWSLPTANTAGYSHKILDAVNSRAGDPLFSLHLGAALPTASDGNAVDRTQVIRTGQALAGPALAPGMPQAADGLATDAALYTFASRANTLAGVGGGHVLAAADNNNDRDGGRVVVAAAPGADVLRGAHTSRMPFVLPDVDDSAMYSVAGPRNNGIEMGAAPPMHVDGSGTGGTLAAYQVQRQAADAGGGPLPMMYTGRADDGALQVTATLPRMDAYAAALPGGVADGWGLGMEALGHAAPLTMQAGAGTAPMPLYTANVADAGTVTYTGGQQLPTGAGQASAPIPMSATGRQGVETVMRALAGTGAWGVPELDPTAIRPVASGGQGNDAATSTLAGTGAYGPAAGSLLAVASGGGAADAALAASAPQSTSAFGVAAPLPSTAAGDWGADAAVRSAPTSITAGVPTDGARMLPVDTQNRGVDSRVMATPQALEVQGDWQPRMPSARDGTLAWDSLLRRLAVPAEYNMNPAALPAMSDNMVGARAPSVPLRVSNNATLFATGQGLGADQNLPTLAAEGGSGKDASQFGALRQAQELQLYEQSARAHPSTYGAGAEFRNVYIGPDCDRKGLVSLNPETVRTMTSPARLVMEAAAAEQLRKRDAAMAAKDATMYATRVAYESDYANSEAE